MASWITCIFVLTVAIAVVPSSSKSSPDYSPEEFGWSEEIASFVAREIRRVLRSLADGSLPDDLPPMDPVRMSDITFCRGYGPVRATIDFPYSTLAGVSAVDEVTAVRCDGGESTITFTTHHGQVVQDGLYNLTGSFGDVFAVGKGNAHIVLRDVTIHHRLQWRRARGELRVRDYRGAVVPRDMTVRYGNLRSETRDVMEDECRRHNHDVDVNKYFNENWRVLYDALSQSVDFAFSAVFRDYMDVLLRVIEHPLGHCDGLHDHFEEYEEEDD